MASLEKPQGGLETPRPQSQSTGEYDAPDSYRNLDDAPATLPIEVPSTSSGPTRRLSLRRNRADSIASRASARSRERHVDEGTSYSVPDNWANLDELAAPAPVENIHDGSLYRHTSLDETRGREARWQGDQKRRRASLTQGGPAAVQAEREMQAEERIEEEDTKGVKVSRLATEFYTISYLVLFAILGTLARLGMTALTKYPGTPVIFNTVWSNFTGSLVMGFLAEDRMLFRHEWGTPTYDREIERARRKDRDEENGSGPDLPVIDLTVAKRAHLATKKTIPLYIGLATGFCGSFTTFSSFIKDVFLALSNELVTPGVSDSPPSRNGGYSFMAMLAVIITTVCLSLSGLFIGAHLALALEGFTPSIPFSLTRRILDPLAVFLGWGCWIGAVFLSIFPPHTSWRGQATFALVFGPLGCLARFYISLYLNGKVASFPVGTFVANVSGTVILGMAWDIAHVPIGGVVGCQVLQGIEDGFCGCLTTISTWVAELSSLRRRSAWIYGFVSVMVSLGCMIAIMGGLRWTDGFSALLCSN